VSKKKTLCHHVIPSCISNEGLSSRKLYQDFGLSFLPTRTCLRGRKHFIRCEKAVACLTSEELLYNISTSGSDCIIKYQHNNCCRKVGDPLQKEKVRICKKTRTDILPSETHQLSLPSQQALIQPVKIEKDSSYTSKR